MKKQCFLLISTLALMIALLSACGEDAIAPPTPETVSETLFSFVDANYPNTFMDKDGNPGSDGYIGYVLNAGVTCYTKEDEDGTLIKAGVMIDTSLAAKEALSSGAGCLPILVSIIDAKEAERIKSELELDSMPTGTTTATGSTGSYTYGEASPSIYLMWEAESVAE